MLDATFRQRVEDATENRRVLAQGVKGVTCIDANSVEQLVSKNLLTEVQLRLLHDLKKRLFSDEHFGTIELYEGGAMNIYLKRGGEVFGFFIVRTT